MRHLRHTDSAKSKMERNPGDLQKKTERQKPPDCRTKNKEAELQKQSNKGIRKAGKERSKDGGHLK